MHVRKNLRRPSAARARLGLGLSGALLLLLSTGCAWSGDDDGGGGGGDGGSDGAFPATVDTKFGEVTVDEEPQRVVALGWGDAETALALGVQPVGASDWLDFGGEGVGPWAEGLYDEAPELIGTLEPELDRISELEPDLILDTKTSGDQERYDMLAEIAPTVSLPEGADQYQTSWRDQVTLVAEALGRAERGAELIAETEGEFAAAAEEHPEFAGTTVTAGAYSGAGYGAYVRGGGRVDFLEALGFENNPTVEEQDADGSFSVPISHERLDLLDADLIVMSPIGVEPEVVTEDPLYQAIPAVADGRAVMLDDPTVSSAFATNSVLALPYALEVVVPLLAEAVPAE